MLRGRRLYAAFDIGSKLDEVLGSGTENGWVSRDDDVRSVDFFVDDDGFGWWLAGVVVA